MKARARACWCTPANSSPPASIRAPPAAAPSPRRTRSAVAMKACNFASLDPRLGQRVKGLGNVSTADRQLWEEFLHNPEAIAAKTESMAYRLLGKKAMDMRPLLPPEGPTELFRTVRARR